MELRRDLMLPIFVSIALVLLTSFGAIGLLTRMSPELEHILEDNVYSLEAVEEMLALIATGASTPEAKADFEDALSRAESNVTEDAERPQVDIVRRQWSRALGGDAGARAEVTAALVELGDINRAAMARADAAAQRIGTAGAWAAVLLGAIAFLWGILTARRLDRRVLRPLEEMVDVLRHHERGERFRRCHVTPAPAELVHAMEAINQLCDDRAQSGDTPSDR